MKTKYKWKKQKRGLVIKLLRAHLWQAHGYCLQASLVNTLTESDIPLC